MRKLLRLSIAAMVMMAAVVIARAATYDSHFSPVEPAGRVALLDGAAARLAGSLRIPTISNEDPRSFDAAGFASLHDYLETAFPRVHAQLRREIVGTHSLLYTWEGSDRSLKPILLAGHLDVVPIESGTEAQWQQAPFGGRIVDGFIWGRGAIDNKSAVVGTLEAMEMLLAENFRPARTVYLAYGHDEEAGGTGGARAIAALLQSRGVELEMVLDEGGVIGEGILSDVSAPVALVGIAEKGFVSIELTVRSAGGHSSVPPRQTAIGILSAAIARVEDRPMAARLEGPTQQLFDRVGPQLPFAQRAAFANLWLTRPLVVHSLEGSPATNAMVRTTTAATLFQAGSKDNVLPGHARAAINFRILPGDSVSGVVDHVRRVIDDDRVDVKIGGRFSSEPSPVSSTDSESFKMLEHTIQSMAPDAIVAPYLVVVVSDARHYARLTRNVFRFQPVRVTPHDLERMHGIDERIAVRTYEDAVRTYRQLVLNAAA